MPARLEPFVNNTIYHVFNRSIDNKKIFSSSNNCRLFLDILNYYKSSKAKICYSKFKRLPIRFKNPIIEENSNPKYFLLEILAYCLMPTHFHLLLKQKVDRGIPTYISNTINSFTRTYNLENKRKGPIFLPKFKSVSIQKEEHLLHVSRYIHLNPYSGGMINNIKQISEYHWSSLGEYLNHPITCNTEIILSLFDDNSMKYLEFVMDNADYQKTLEELKYTENW